MEEGRKLCKECGESFAGRSDKVFCSDGCRAAYNNRKYRKSHSTILKTNRILKKNHSILEIVVNKYRGKCSCGYLFGEGFNFDYMTSVRQSRKKGSPSKMICYDISYIINEDGMVKVRAEKMYDTESRKTFRNELKGC